MLSFIFFDKQQLSWTYLYAKNIMASIKNYKYSIPANISCNIFDSENVSVTSQRLPTFYEHYRRYSDDFRTLSQIIIWRAFLTNFEGIKNCCDWYKLRAKEHFLVIACFYSHFFIVWTPTPLNSTLRSKWHEIFD